MPHAFTADFADVHRNLLTLRGDSVEEVFRGAGKSTCLGAVILHACLYGWRRFVLVASWTLEQAVEFVRRARDELEHNERIKEDFGPQVGSKWTEKSFTTAHGVTVRAVGVRKGVRGAVSSYDRPDLLIVDDIENDERVQTIEQRDKLYNRLTTAFFNLGSNVSLRDLWVWVIGTPLHLDCVLRRLKRDGWDYRQTAATVDGTPDGEPTWPPFSREKIAQRIRKIGSKAANQELFMRPMDDGEAAFELEWFRYYTDNRHVDEDWDRYIYIDPAIGEKKQNDYFCAWVVAVSPWGTRPEIRVVDVYRDKLSFGRQIQKLFLLDDIHRPISVGIESNAYQDSLRQQVLEQASRDGVRRPPVIPVHSSRCKELRIRDSSPAVEFGEVLFAEKHAEYIHIMCEWPGTTHDDVPDAFAGVTKMVRRQGRLQT